MKARISTIVKKIPLEALSLRFCNYINTTAYRLGKYEPSSPTTLLDVLGKARV